MPNKLYIAFILLISILAFNETVTGQQKQKEGYLFGHVVFAPIKEGDYGTLAIGVIVELQRKKRTINIVSNEAGLMMESLPPGKYLVISVKTVEGKLLDFIPDQNKDFQIKHKKTERFDIGLLNPDLKN